MNYKLSILDQSPVLPGTTAVKAFKQTVYLAQKAEEWGYSRFWVSEHHQTDELAGSSPEVLISYLLAKTNSIHIGSGGVMLQHYSPYKVAENFHVLSTLAPGRVDLGIGKAPGGLPLSTKALQYGTVKDGKDFSDRLSFLKSIIENSVDDHHPLAGIQAIPIPPVQPEIFLLGASVESAKLAADLGISFVFALFLNSDLKDLAEAARIFRQEFPNGKFYLSVSVVAAQSKVEAEQLASNQKIVKVHLQSGRTVKVSSLEKANEFGHQAGEPFEIEELDSQVIAGTPEYVKGILDQFQKTYLVDEFILHTPIQKAAERLRSFQLLSPKINDKGMLNQPESEKYIVK